MKLNNANEIFKVFRNHRNELDRLDVKRLALFGSVTRGTITPKSDIDILVEFSKPVGLFQFIQLKGLLEKKLGRSVDLVTPDAIRKEMKKNILNEAIYDR